MPIASSSPVDADRALSVTDADLAAAVRAANVPTLLMVLVQMTGDLCWLEEPFVLSRTKGMQDNDTGGLADELQDRVRSAAAEAIAAWRAGKPLAVPDPSPELIVRMLSTSMGEPVPAEYGEMLVDELDAGLGHVDDVRPAAVPDGFRALVIGAGISGVAAGVMLDRLGVPYEILERNTDIGGVWLENTYPGAGVDTPSHLYSYSFAPNDWTRYFASQPEILGYVRDVADRFSVRGKVRFGSEVVRCEWRPDDGEWEIEVRTNGIISVERASLVLSCVGAFNPPIIPEIPGLEDFSGQAFHTARWPHDLELAGKDVVVVGNGASAMQVVPAIVDQVRKLTIFQRSPQWVQPFEKFQQDVSASVRLLFEEVPLYRAWYRLRLSWIFHDKLYESLQRDDAWADSSIAINHKNDAHRQYFTRYIETELGDRQDLLDKVVPKYPPFGKRMLQDNGWFRALRRGNVELVVDAVARVEREYVVGATGHRTRADVLVLATGFDVVRFLSTFEAVGTSGESLREVWEDDNCRAYLGLFVPGFPNFASIYGPNTQTGHGGSLIHTVEAQLHYLSNLLRATFEQGGRVFEVKPERYKSYTDTVDALHDRMIWTHPAMSTYYRNSSGRVVAISPFRNLDYWTKTRACDITDFSVSVGATNRRIYPSGAAPEAPDVKNPTTGSEGTRS